MKITKNTVVTVEYKLSDMQGNPLEEGRSPMVYMHGGYENTLLKIEQALDGKEVGYEAVLQLEPDDAFGEYDPALVNIEPRDRLPDPLEVGMQFEGVPHGSDEDDDAIVFTVTGITGDQVTLDGNHPLAGMALRYALSVVDVRQATNDELAHKHAHGGADGHDHGHDHDHLHN